MYVIGTYTRLKRYKSKGGRRDTCRRRTQNEPVFLFPQGIRIQAKHFATHIQKEDIDLVTVGGETYREYRYEGVLNDTENGVVFLCWPQEAFGWYT